MQEGSTEGDDRRNQRLLLLRTLWELLQQADNLAAVVACVEHEFPHHLQVDRATILFHDARLGGLISGLLAQEPDMKCRASQLQHMWQSISGLCFTENRLITVNDCSQSELISGEYVSNLGLKSTMAIPITCDSLPVGVLRLDDTKNTNRFSSRDEDFYMLVAEQISLVIRQLQLFADRDAAEEALRLAYDDMETRVEERTRELARLNHDLNRELHERRRAEKIASAFARLGQKLSIASTPHEAARATLESADELFGWDACAAALRRKGTDYQVLHIEDTFEGVRRQVDQPSTWEEGTLTRRVLEEGPQLILRFQSDTREDPAQMGTGFFGNQGRRSASIMMVPVTLKGRPIGLLSVHSYRTGAYSPKDLDVFSALASFCSGALERTATAQQLAESVVALQQERRLVALLGEVARAANESESFESALLKALQEVCGATGWAAGHAILKKAPGEPPEFVSTRLWHTDEPERFAALRQISETLVFTPDNGLPSLVLEGGQPALITCTLPQPWMRRVAQFHAAQLKAAFFFPILVGRQVVGTLEFFSRDNAVPSSDLMEVMAHVGVQLGRAAERKKAAEQLAHDALHDTLTGLPNRRFLVDCIERASARARRHSEYRFALLYLNLDRFKVINDSMGHGAGDQFLVAVARRLEGCLREGDVVARLGGDEFAILLDDVHGAADAVTAAERIQEELSLPIQVGDCEVCFSASIGIVLSRSGGNLSPVELLRDADVAMYRAKTGGRRSYAVFDEAMHAQVMLQMRMETELRRAIERGELVIQYQPIVSMADSRIMGFEALVRWRHPERGLLPPADFIPLAEETGLIIPLGWEVLRQACLWMRARLDAAPRVTELFVSVNVTARQLREPDLLGRVRAVLEEAALPPQCLHLEVTESSVMENVDETIEVLTSLHALGVQILVDDFGTGYSSLSYLARFPIDALKIDQSFVRGLSVSSGNSEVVQAILALACGLRLGVVAEGVETRAQLAQLRGLGCELTQGFLFSRPLDADEALAIPLVMPEPLVG